MGQIVRCRCVACLAVLEEDVQELRQRLQDCLDAFPDREHISLLCVACTARHPNGGQLAKALGT